jgi:hypothetical protein
LLTSCIVDHCIKVRHVSQAITAQLQAVGSKAQTIVASIQGSLAVVRTPARASQQQQQQQQQQQLLQFDVI